MVFSLVEAAILKPLPVKDPVALRIVEWTNKGFPEGVQNVNGDVWPMSGDRLRGSSVGANLYRRLARERARLVRGRIRLHGWVYQIETGEVFAFDLASGQFVPLAEYQIPAGEVAMTRRTTSEI